MQSRHSVTGIQYQRGVISDYKNISLLAQSLARNYLVVSARAGSHPVVILLFYYELTLSAVYNGLNANA